MPRYIISYCLCFFRHILAAIVHIQPKCINPSESKKKQLRGQRAVKLTTTTINRRLQSDTMTC